MDKIFGNIKITWKRLIIFSVICGLYASLMMIISATKGTSFRDFAVSLEWWVFFGIIIIMNSKSCKECALKCFVFFLISQILFCLIQIPFIDIGFKIFVNNKIRFLWVILSIPLGFILYFINKRNIVSSLLLVPVVVLLSYLGLGYFHLAFSSFPHHLFSGLVCFAFVIIIILSLFDNIKIIIFEFVIVLLMIIVYVLFRFSIFNTKYEETIYLDRCNITLKGKGKIDSFSGDKDGSVEFYKDDNNKLIIKGKRNSRYEFVIIDEKKNEYSFVYFYNKEKNRVVLIYDDKSKDKEESEKKKKDKKDKKK